MRSDQYAMKYKDKHAWNQSKQAMYQGSVAKIQIQVPLKASKREVIDMSNVSMS